MDRDDSLIVSGSALLAVVDCARSFADGFPRLPANARNDILAMLPLMREIESAKKKRPAMDAIALRTSRAKDTLKRWFYRYRRLGPAGLVDHRKCGGCGMAECDHEREVALTEKVVQLWQSKAITNDKRGMAESWKGIIRALCAGEVVEDAGTWRDVFAKAHPFRNPPQHCPWSLHRPPPGWSLSTFLTHKPADVVYALSQKGSFAAWPHLPEVRVDLSTLRPFEWLVVDDHRLDFQVYVQLPGGGVQLVELWGLFVMDVATRMIVSFALKPRVMREDGSHMAFEMRDMQHLIAHVLGSYGIPRDYDQTWIVENAAAAVSTEAEQLVSLVSGGRVKIKRTGIQVGDFSLSGFPERWGNYRGKRWLEVWFAALDIVLGGVKGQMGSEYWVKPGSFDARKAFGNRLLKLLDKCTPDIRAKLTLPFEWAGDAHWLISDAIELLNHRTDHELDGFEPVRFFAYDASSTMIPLHPQLAELHGVGQHLATFAQVPTDLQNIWLSHGGTPRRMTPAEKMAIHMPRMDRLSTESLVDLFFDEITTYQNKPLTYRGGDVLDLEVRRGREKVKMRFAGALPGIEIGTQVIARLNTDRIECGAWILDGQRRVIGHLTHRGTPTHDDLEGLHRELGTKIRALKQATGIVERITNNRKTTERRIGEVEELTMAVNTLRSSEEPEELPALPESRAFAAAVAKSTSRAPTTRKALRDLRKGQG